MNGSITFYPAAGHQPVARVSGEHGRLAFDTDAYAPSLLIPLGNEAYLDRLIEADLILKTVTIYRHVALDAATPDGRGYRQQGIIEVPELIANREPLAAQLDHFLDMLAGKVDVDAERLRILPAHRVVGRLVEDNSD